MLQNKKLIAGVGIVVTAAAVFFWILTRQKDVPSEVETQRKLAAFLDWNLTPEGPLADEARTLMTERLVDVGRDGRYIYRLAGSVEHDQADPDHIARVQIKDNIYWSDQTQLTAQHFVDAWERYKSHGKNNPEIMDAEGTRRWMARVSIKATDKLQLELSGFDSKEDLTGILRSRYLIPVRMDLIKADEGGEKAWLTTIGRYRLQGLPPEQISASSELEFTPNPMYYRGAASETVRVAIGKLATSEAPPTN